MTESSTEISRGPVAPKRPGSPRIFHGDSFADPWEWLRDKESPEVIAHLEAENAWTDRVCAPTTELSERLVDEYRRHTVETDTSVPARRGDYWYYQRTTEGLSYPAHYRVAVDSANDVPPTIIPGVELAGEELLVDEEAEAKGGEFFRLATLAPSPDGRLVAWARDVTGDERWTVVVTEVASGRVVDESVTDTGYGLAWSADSGTLLYSRVDDAWRQHQLWTHRVGADPSEDVLVLQEDDERFDLWFITGRDPNWVVVQSTSTTTSENWLWSTECPDDSPIPVTGRTPDVLVSVEPAGDQLLVVHTATSREGTLATAPLMIPAVVDGPIAPPSSWQPLREAGPGERILEVEAYRTFLVLSLRSGGLTQLEYRLRSDDGDGWGEGHFVEAASPVRTVVAMPSKRYEDVTFRLETQSLTLPPTVEDLNPATGQRRTLKTLEVPDWGPEDYIEERVWVTARDGETQIPVSLVHRRGAAADGTGAGLLYGYGSYEISIDPEFSVLRLPLLERGVVYAIAHIRGGGEMGRAWYEAGKLDVKSNTFTDFVDVADWMVDSGWVSPDLLAVQGGSAGGLLMGAVTNLSPSRFRVVLAQVPFVDPLTSILDPALPLTVGEWEEWGNPIESAEIYRVMKDYSPYENVRDGIEYPAVLAVTSLNDTRVLYVEPAKWVQRLREASVSDPRARPIAMRTEMVAGHGGKSGRYGLWESRAEQYAFVLGQLGISD